MSPLLLIEVVSQAVTNFTSTPFSWLKQMRKIHVKIQKAPAASVARIVTIIVIPAAVIYRIKPTFPQEKKTIAIKGRMKIFII